MYSAMIFLVSERSRFRRSESGEIIFVSGERKKKMEQNKSEIGSLCLTHSHFAVFL